MAFSHGSNAEIYIDDVGGTERNFTTYITDVDWKRSLDSAETTTLSNTAKSYIPGLKDLTFGINGKYDPTAEGYLNGIHGNRAQVQVKYFPNGSASGRTYYDGTAFITDLGIKSGVEAANEWSSEWQFITNPTFGTA